jgi:hypothetical protein
LAIRASHSREITALVSDLASDRPAVREAAVARLTVIGARASSALAAIVIDRHAPPTARTAALRIFEATTDSKGMESALAVVDESNDDIVSAAIAALAPHVRSAEGAAVVDRLTAIALDRRRAGVIREAAVRALLDLDTSSLRPLLKALRNDRAPEIAALVANRRSGQPPPDEPGELLARAVNGRLPSDGEMVRRALARAGDAMTLPDVLTLIERLRDHEKAQPSAGRGQWQAARAAAHLVLARRASRIALYDLRETVETAKEPIAMEFLAALDALGDASCVEAVARAYAATPDAWWRGHLLRTFGTIVRREGLTRRHTAIKKLRERHPRVLEEMWAGGPGKAGGPRQS